MRKCLTQDCDGNLLIQESHNYNGYLIAEKISCNKCEKSFLLSQKNKIEFENNIEILKKLIVRNYPAFLSEQQQNLTKSSENKKVEKTPIEETASHILKILMPEYEFFKVDMGNGLQSQYDLLAINNNSSIAIEVTQAINPIALQSSITLKKNNIFSRKKLKFEWIISFNVEADFSSKEINNTLDQLESELKILEQYTLDNNLLWFDPDNFLLRKKHIGEILKNLKDMGFIRCYGKPSESGVIMLYGPFESGSPDPIHLLKIASAEAWKGDNRKKLESALTNERHLFIPIMQFQNPSANTLELLNPGEIFIPINDACQKINLTEVLPNIIDVIWLALSNFNHEGKLSFKIAKITKSDSQIKIQTFAKKPYLF